MNAQPERKFETIESLNPNGDSELFVVRCDCGARWRKEAKRAVYITATHELMRWDDESEAAFIERAKTMATDLAMPGGSSILVLEDSESHE